MLFLKVVPYKVSQFRDSQNVIIGVGSIPSEYSTFWIEVDLREEQKEKRYAHFFINETQLDYYIYNVPESVKVGVCYNLYYTLPILIFF